VAPWVFTPPIRATSTWPSGAASPCGNTTLAIAALKFSTFISKGQMPSIV
jgi:hypothetical protein